MWEAFANAKATHIFFSKNISVSAIINYQSFNDMLTNNIEVLNNLALFPKSWSVQVEEWLVLWTES